MADQDDARAPVGSVAEEAARLLDALGGWVSTSGYAAAPPSADAPGPVAPDGTGPEATVPKDEVPRTAVPEDAVPPGETRSHGPGHCEQCGAANGTGQAVTCQWCPVCQGIGLLRSVRPETVDRLADLAGALATALRDVATHSRSTGAGRTRAGSTEAEPPPPHDARPRGARVQDITIEDEDQGSATR